MEKLLFAANSGLALSIMVMMASVVIAYPLADQFSMAAQIAAHIAMLIFALGIKVSYITRLVALKELGRALH